ncbi:MAG TPA: uracil-DNA glycosylase [Bacteroidota bacterium]|nr:uracil-DNA glycosylase [Bacteroidota bacterium]
MKSLLTNVQKFLAQQKELYGDIVYRRGESATPKESHTSMAQLPMQTEKPAATKRDLFPQQQVDLFGNPLVHPQQSAASGVADAPVLPYPNEPWVAATSLDQLNSMICNCTKCSLGFTRKNFVFGVGNPKAEVVMVGEAPGADEDEQGEPFVGRAGQLLNKILEAIHFKREEVYICNILKCRPPNNRDPLPDEIEKCEPHLWKQLEIIRPKMILCLGRIAAQALLKTNASLSTLRGKVHNYRGIKLMVTYHPAALLRNPNWKRPAWEDVQLFRKHYDELKAGEQVAR